jgi:hypothetical protein
MMKVLARRYLLYGIILSLMLFFAFLKGETYVRMENNRTYYTMNAHLWAPWFALPNICTLLQALDLHGRLRHCGDVFEFHVGRKV